MNILQKFAILAVVLVAVVLFIGGLVSSGEVQRQRDFAQSFAKCKLESIDKNPRYTNNAEYLYLCLNAKGFENDETLKRLPQLSM